MLIGSSTSHKLQVITDAAADIRTTLSIISTDVSTPPVPQGGGLLPVFVVAITTAKTEDILVGAASTQKRVMELSLYNAHATVATSVTIVRTDGTTTNPGIKCVLLPGESFVYNGGVWLHYDTNGGVYGPTNPKLDAKLRVASNVVNATTSFADITGLTAPLQSGKKYAFEASITHIGNATTTGAQFGVNIGATPTALLVNGLDVILNSATAATMASGVATAVDTASIVETTGAAANALHLMSGFIQPSADGTFAVRLKSEVAVAAGVTVLAGSWLRIWECDN